MDKVTSCLGYWEFLYTGLDRLKEGNAPMGIGNWGIHV